MSEITLSFVEYQEIRDALAFARGAFEARGVDLDAPMPGFTTLKEAGQILEAARWRTEEAEQVMLKGACGCPRPS